MNVTIQPELLKWARVRAALAIDELARKVGSKQRPAPIEEWERTGIIPLKKLELIAEKTHAPFGMLFLPEPPEEPLPIRDFRRGNNSPTLRPSLELLETIYDCQFRQAWMSENLKKEGAKPLEYISSASITEDPLNLARKIRDFLMIGVSKRSQNRTIGEATLWMMSRLEEADIIIQRSGVVRNQTRRALNPSEFKGFALADKFAPLIFINGKDWPASQMFTIAHECAHLWLGISALPDGDWAGIPNDPVERFCNQVAAEILMPVDEITRAWVRSESASINVSRLYRQFHVSRLALLIRARTLGLISESEFVAARNEAEREFEEMAPKAAGSGGNYYNTAGTRLGKRFIREVLSSTLEGKTLYTEAFELLGIKETKVFNGLVQKFLLEEKPKPTYLMRTR